MKAETLTVSAFFVYHRWTGFTGVNRRQSTHSVIQNKNRPRGFFGPPKTAMGMQSDRMPEYYPPAYRLSAKGCPQLPEQKSPVFPAFSCFWIPPAGVHKSITFIEHPPHTRSDRRVGTSIGGKEFQGSPTIRPRLFVAFGWWIHSICQPYLWRFSKNRLCVLWL